MPVFNNALAGAAGSGGADAGYTIKRSLRLNRSDDAHLSKSPRGGNRKKWTISFWYKPCLGSGTERHPIIEARNSSNYHSVINFRHDHKFEIYHYTTGLQFQVLTTAFFRDPSAWYHFVVAYDTDQSGADKVKIFCNGVRITEFDTASYPSDSYGEALWCDNNTPHTIGRHGSDNLHGYLAEFYWLDGIAPGISTDDASGSVTGTASAQYLTDFGAFNSTTGVWNPIAYTGSFGTQGYYLPFSPDTTLTHPNKYVTQSGSSTPPSNASTLTYNTGNYFGNNQGVTYDAGSVRKFWVQPGSSDPVVKTSDNGTSWTTVFDGSVGWNDPIEVNCRYVYMSSSGNGFGPYFKQPAFAADASGNDNHWLDQNLFANQTPATTSHQYWRIVIYGLNNSHWPRMSKLYMYDANGTRYTHKNFTSDNCNDQGSIPDEGGVYSADYTNSYNFTNVGIYSTYNGGHRSGYADVYYSDDDNRWTYSFTTVVANNASCGEIVGTLADTDNLIDSPTNYQADSGNNGGNYATWNPVDQRLLTNGPTYTLSNGNLVCDMTAGSANASKDRGLCTSTIQLQSGKKYYCEIKVNSLENNDFALGIASPTVKGYYELGGNWKSGAYMLRSSGQFYHPTGQEGSSSSRSYSSGDLIGIAVDLESPTKTITFYKNGSSLYSHNVNLGEGPFAIAAGIDASNTQTYKITANFGQKPFSQTVPTGYISLCTTNLDDPPIANGRNHFDTQIWTGDNTSGAVTVTGYKFSPEFIWAKSRSHAYSNNLYDIVRGTGKGLYSDNNGTEVTNNQYGYVSQFNSNGFTASAGSSDNDFFNGTNKTYVAFGWNAGDTNTPVSAGGLNSSVYNDDQTWSGGLSGSGSGGGFAQNEGATVAFDGNTSTKARWTGTSDGVLTFTPSTAISATTLRVKGHFWKASSSANEDVMISVNGGTYVVPVDAGLTTYAETVAEGADLFIDCTSLITNSQVTSVALKRRGTVSSATGLTIFAIEVNGKILVDSNQTPPNVPTNASTCRTDTTSGFSIVTWTASSAGDTIAHKLGKKPSMIIAKSRSVASQPWAVYHSSLGRGGVLILDEVSGNSTNWSTYWGNNEPDSNVFGTYTGQTPWANNAGNMVAYCFSEIEGYSQFGKYSGNSSTSGPFIYTGFKPAWIMVKKVTNTDSNSGWHIYDARRDPNNRVENWVLAESEYYENRAANNTADMGGHYNWDFYSNGFRPVHSSNNLNQSNSEYIYAAFASSPFKHTRAR